MSVAKQILSSRKTGQEPGGGLYVDDVFSSYVRRGNGASDTVISGQDLANDGGMVWTKGRSGTYGATDHYLFHTARGTDIFLSTKTTNGQGAFTAGTSLNSFNNNGFTLGASPYVNDSATDFVAWVFKNSPRFYGHQVVTKVAGTSKTVNFPELGTLGMVRVKKIDGTGSWYVWHRSLSAGQLLIGESTANAATLGHVTVSGTTVTLVNGVIADGAYLVEAFAHDTALDGIVQCGSFVQASGAADVTLGWEPQTVFVKRINAFGNFVALDVSRDFLAAPLPGSSKGLILNQSSAEAAVTTTGDAYGSVNQTGFRAELNGFNGDSYIYLAIRRPNKPPTSGTQVYNAIARNGTSVPTSITGVGFAPDLVRVGNRTFGGVTYDQPVVDRLRGDGRFMRFDSAAAESPGIDAKLRQDGINIPAIGNTGLTGTSYIDHYFKRAPGFMDIVCDTGTGAAHAISHGLGAVPQMMIRKARSMSSNWYVWHSALAPTATNKVYLNSYESTSVDVIAWDGTNPTASQFRVGVHSSVNNNGTTYVTYLFATLAGISKVGSYTGNGGSQPIACGFTTGARFVLAKRIDAPGDWFVWDTARGILPANDPHLSLNSTNAEVTTDDSIDPDSAGFIVNQNTATNINVLGGSYIFLAIA